VGNKKSIEQEINDCLEKWDCKQLCSFLKDIIPLLELYNVDEEDDWVRDTVGTDNLQNVRLIRTVYLLSKIAENHAASLCHFKVSFRNLYKRMEKLGMDLDDKATS
jgi:hypothetical protein